MKGLNMKPTKRNLQQLPSPPAGHPLLLGALLLALFTPSVNAANDSACAYKNIDPAQYGNKPFQNPPEIVSVNGSLNTDMSVKYTDPRTTSLGGCPLTLRTYNGQLVGPTLRIKQGDTINLKLDNQLPKETPDQIQVLEFLKCQHNLVL